MGSFPSCAVFHSYAIKCFSGYCATNSGGMEKIAWSTQELLTLGLTDREIRNRVARGSLVRVRRGHYIISGETVPEAAHLRLLAATLPHLAPENVISHTSAALLHGFPVRRPDLEQVTTIRRTPGHGCQSRKLRARHTAITDSEITLAGHIPVTTQARTVCDLARTAPFEWAVAAADAALHQGLDPADLEIPLDLHPALRGTTRARRVLAFADGRSESPAESISRVHMARAGIPSPVLQHEVFDRNGEFVARLDFAWPDLGLAGEVDGRIKYDDLLPAGHDPIEVILAEKQREERIRQATGWWLVRWDWNTACDPVKLGTLLREAIHNANAIAV